MPYLVLFILVILLALLVRAGYSANEVDWGGPFLNWLDGINRLFCRWFHRLRVEDTVLPDTGCALVAANHVSGLDPLLMIAASHRKLHFLIAREQYERWWVHWLFRAIGCIPVDRGGRPEQAFREARRVLEAGGVVAVFPHGTIHLDTDPPVRLKAGVAKLAQMTGCSVYPVRLDGIRAQGHVIFAVFVPSRARVTWRPPLQYRPEEEAAHLLETLAGALDRPGDPPPKT